MWHNATYRDSDNVSQICRLSLFAAQQSGDKCCYLYTITYTWWLLIKHRNFYLIRFDSLRSDQGLTGSCFLLQDGTGRVLAKKFRHWENSLTCSSLISLHSPLMKHNNGCLKHTCNYPHRYLDENYRKLRVKVFLFRKKTPDIITYYQIEITQIDIPISVKNIISVVVKPFRRHWQKKLCRPSLPHSSGWKFQLLWWFLGTMRKVTAPVPCHFSD